jgi:hypothetical protein
MDHRIRSSAPSTVSLLADGAVVNPFMSGSSFGCGHSDQRRTLMRSKRPMR